MTKIEQLAGVTLNGGRYELLQPAAPRTQMAIVYQAYDHRTEQKVAVKILLPDATSSLRERFTREAMISYQLGHQNIASTTDYNLNPAQDNGYIYLVMKWLPGETLEKLIKTRNPNTAVLQILDEGVHIVTRIAAALDYLHERGIVHRDVKPGNIMMYEGEPYLLDFGIAKKLDETSEVDMGLTYTDAAIPGTPRYMSPEQFMFCPVDGRTDQYSLALVAYDWIVGGDSASAVEPGNTLQVGGQSKQSNGGQLSPGGHYRQVSPVVWEVLQRALQKDPNDRYPTIVEFAEAFANAVEEDDTLRVSPHLLAVSGISFIILCLLGLFILSLEGTGERRADAAVASTPSFVEGVGTEEIVSVTSEVQALTEEPAPTSTPTSTPTFTLSPTPSETPNPAATFTAEAVLVLCRSADLNRDGTVDEADFEVIQGARGLSVGDTEYVVDYDIDRDGSISLGDTNFVRVSVGSMCAALPIPTDCERADHNGDQKVDDADVMLIQEVRGLQVGDERYNEAYDIDRDGRIGLGDYNFTSVNRNQTCE